MYCAKFMCHNPFINSVVSFPSMLYIIIIFGENKKKKAKIISKQSVIRSII